MPLVKKAEMEEERKKEGRRKGRLCPAEPPKMIFILEFAFLVHLMLKNFIMFLIL